MTISISFLLVDKLFLLRHSGIQCQVEHGAIARIIFHQFQKKNPQKRDLIHRPIVGERSGTSENKGEAVRMTFGPHYHTSTCVLIQYSPWRRQFFINCICKSADIQGHEVHPRWIETCWRAVMPHGRSHRIMLSLHYQRVFFAPCFIGILNRYSKECRLWTPAWALWDRLALPSNLMRRACPRGQYRLFDSSIVYEAVSIGWGWDMRLILSEVYVICGSNP